MSTAYYARIIPTEEAKKKLKEAIDRDDFGDIRTRVDLMYGEISPNYNDGFEGGVVHLGSYGGEWKFLWNPNCYVQRDGHTEWTEFKGGRSGHWVEDSKKLVYLYPLTKKGIKAFIDRKDVIICDEYGEIQDKEQFWKDAIEWGKQGFDSASYEKSHPNSRKWQHEGELVNMLAEAYEFISWSHSDFYSDGLRFSTSTNFR
jgi:hypothetical protein